MSACVMDKLLSCTVFTSYTRCQQDAGLLWRYVTPAKKLRVIIVGKEYINGLFVIMNYKHLCLTDFV